MSASKADNRALGPPALAMRAPRWLASPVAIVLLLSLLMPGALALTRDFMTFGTETDFLGGFVPEAERILAGRPLQLEYHPPLYSFVIAAVWLVLRDWFASGLLVSVLAGGGLAVVGYELFRRVAGREAGWGAALGLLASPVFVAYAAFATSEVLFTFLYLATLLLAVAAWEGRARGLWLACGAVAGLTLLTRTNGLAVLVVLFAPALAASVPGRRKLGDAAAVALGLALPLALWAVYALITGSRLTPGLTHGALAQTYFVDPELRYAGPVRLALEQRFGGVWEVLMHDPARMTQIYARDLLMLVRRLFERDELLRFPLNHLAVPGLLVLLVLRARPVLWLLAGAMALHVLLLNFKPFEARFYLFLAPLLGAAVAAIALELLRLVRTGPKATLARATVGLIALGAVAQAVVFTYPRLHAQDELFAELTQAGATLPPAAGVFAMRPQVPFHLKRRSLYAARIDSIEHLARLARAAAREGPVYVYVGEDERAWWAWVEELERRESQVASLTPVARGTAGKEAWVLYRFGPSGLYAAREAVAE